MASWERQTVFPADFLYSLTMAPAREGKNQGLLAQQLLKIQALENKIYTTTTTTHPKHP